MFFYERRRSSCLGTLIVSLVLFALGMLLFVTVFSGAIAFIIGILCILLTILPIWWLLQTAFELLKVCAETQKIYGGSFSEIFFSWRSIKGSYSQIFSYAFNLYAKCNDPRFANNASILVQLAVIFSIPIAVILLLIVQISLVPVWIIIEIFKKIFSLRLVISDRDRRILNYIGNLFANIKKLSTPKININFNKNSRTGDSPRKVQKKPKYYKEIVFIFPNESEQNEYYEKLLKSMKTSKNFDVNETEEENVYSIKKNKKASVKFLSFSSTIGLEKHLTQLEHLSTIVLFLNTSEIVRELNLSNSITTSNSDTSFDTFYKEFINYSSSNPNVVRNNFVFVIPHFTNFDQRDLRKKEILTASDNLDSILSYWEGRSNISKKIFLSHSSNTSLFYSRLKGTTTFHILGDKAEQSSAVLNAHLVNIMESII